MGKKSTKRKLGIVLGLAVAGVGVYLWYKNRTPNFKIIETNPQDKSVRWQYGSIINLSRAGQNNTYSNAPQSDFYVNVSPIEREGEVVGMRFNFLGKDQREPQLVYFE